MINIDEEIKAKLAVFIIDMQDDFIMGNKAKLALIPRQINLIKFCQENNLPLFLVEYNGHGRTVAPLLEEINKISRDNLYLVLKDHWSPFSSTAVAEVLRDIGIEYVLVSGVNACACVYETLAESVDLGFKPLVSYDLMAGYCDDCLDETNRQHWELSGFKFIEFEAG